MEETVQGCNDVAYTHFNSTDACCGDGSLIPDCNGNCYPSAVLGDGVCDKV